MGGKDNPPVAISVNHNHIRDSMTLRAGFRQRTFHFGFEARTSRGAMRDKKSTFIRLWNADAPDIFGIGECGPLPGLSADFKALSDHTIPPESEDSESKVVPSSRITSTIESINQGSMSIADFITQPGGLDGLHKGLINLFGEKLIAENSALTFALETAVLDLHHGGKRIIFDNSFIRGTPIPINGLIWMGGLDFMLQQIDIKIKDGFRCIKLKVGSLNFEKECDILQYIRRKYFRENIEIRLDANGAFKPDNALFKLSEYAKYGIHSIEQPLKPGSDELEHLCRTSPIPIALDEELIGIYETREKAALLDRIRPAYIILKPTLHGGLYGCSEWIQLATARSIGWWITSALESNIGLNAICQLTAGYSSALPQGLGTGAIYTDNFESPLQVKNAFLSHSNELSWNVENI